MPNPIIISGIDLADVHDFAAIATAQVTVRQRKDRPGTFENFYSVVGLHRFERSIGYTAQATHLQRMFAKPPLTATKTAIDYTSVGRPTLEIFTIHVPIQAWFCPILYTGGHACTLQEDGSWHVAKASLASALVSVVENGRYEVAGSLKYRTVLEAEMQSFTKKLTAAANEKFEAAKGKNDDLCMALAELIWMGEHTPIGWDGSLGMGNPIQQPPRGSFGREAKGVDPYREDGRSPRQVYGVDDAQGGVVDGTDIPSQW
jgi:hypothetical protein